MYLRPRVISKQSPQLGGRELPSTVCLEGKCFQRCTGQVFALCRQVSGNVFGEIKGDPHKAILRASECRRQPHVLGGFAQSVVGRQGHHSPLSALSGAPPAPELAHRPHDAHVGDVQIALRDFEFRVPEQHLDLANVEAIFKPPRRALVS